MGWVALPRPKPLSLGSSWCPGSSWLSLQKAACSEEKPQLSVL